MKKNLLYFMIGMAVWLLPGACNLSSGEGQELRFSDTYTNPLLPHHAFDASVAFHDGMYYFTCETGASIYLWATPDITDLTNVQSKEIWKPADERYNQHIWDPEICYIRGKWYIYFAADDGNTDNHQLYVIECDSDDPMTGSYTLRGPIVTNTEWNFGLHPSPFEHRGELYLLWSGWPSRRINTETQCIYLARMKNPWTLDSERVLLSSPEYEWERQWINPDGSRTAYPIYVNEAPELFRSRNGSRLFVYYSASGCWSPYYCSGCLSADADAPLLDPKSWEKSPVPVFLQQPADSIFGPGSFSFVSSPDSTEWYVLYHANNVPNSLFGGVDTRTVRMQPVKWDDNGMPDLGNPLPLSVTLPKPSGTPKKNGKQSEKMNHK